MKLWGKGVKVRRKLVELPASACSKLEIFPSVHTAFLLFSSSFALTGEIIYL